MKLVNDCRPARLQDQLYHGNICVCVCVSNTKCIVSLYPPFLSLRSFCLSFSSRFLFFWAPVIRLDSVSLPSSLLLLPLLLLLLLCCCVYAREPYRVQTDVRRTVFFSLPSFLLSSSSILLLSSTTIRRAGLKFEANVFTILL